jgi:hypothetical protein
MTSFFSGDKMDSSKWVKLIDLENKSIGRATRFLVKESKIYEPLVEFFLVEDPTSPSQYTLYVSTGHKAGCVRVCLPAEARVKEEKVLAISGSWLIKNWKHWVIDTDPAEVLCRVKYEAGV